MIVTPEGILPWHVVVDDDGAAALANVEDLRGSLFLRAGVTACVLPRLRSITGHLSLEGCVDLVELRLDALERVGCQLTIFGAGLATLVLPSLTEIGSCLELDGNLALECLSLPALRSIGASLILDDNPALRLLALPSLALIGITAARSNCAALDDEEWTSLRRRARQPDFFR